MSYSKLITKKYPNIVTKVHVQVGSYDGDGFVLFFDFKTKQYGYLTYGYGSCSCCDCYAACETEEDFDRLTNRLYDSIKWGTTKEMISFIKNRDWKACTFGDDNEIYKFKTQALNVLRNKVYTVVPEIIQAPLTHSLLNKLAVSKRLLF